MEENSAEYRTLIDLTSELRLAVRSDLISLSGALLSSRLISPDNETELRNTVHSEAERSARLIELVQNKVRLNSRYYQTFIGILQNNSDQYSDILQRVQHAYSSHRQEGVLLSHINGLECQFRLLHEMIITELEDRNIQIPKVLGSLKLLPIEMRHEYMPSIGEMFPDLRRENSIRELFYHLSPLVDFLGYDLLKYIIEDFGSNTLKEKMKTYSDDVLKFMKETTVKQLMDVWPGLQENLPNFSKLRAKIDEDPTTYTLYQLDQLRRRICAGVKLTDIVLVLIGLETANSFIAEWLVPSTLMPDLIESSRKLEFGFYLRERILKMTLDEKQIFPFLPDSKPKVPALQAAAATTVTGLSDDDKETGQAASQLSSSMEHLRLTSEQQHALQRVRDKLSDCALYSGVAVVCDEYDGPLYWGYSVKQELSSKLNFKPINFDSDTKQSLNSKILFSTVAQSQAYPKPQAAGSPPFVIAIFVSGWVGDSADSLHTRHGPVHIVDDIIKPFLPQSAPHLQHIPKLFFIASFGEHLRVPAWPESQLLLFSEGLASPLAFYGGTLGLVIASHRDHPVAESEPPLFPTDPDANYCVAYYVRYNVQLQSEWTCYITEHLSSSTPVQDIIENSRLLLDKEHDCLHSFSCLKDKLVLQS